MTGGNVDKENFIPASDGGFIIPRIAHIDKQRNGIIAFIIRRIGRRIIRFGSWVQSLGYYQVEIHPHDDIVKAMKEMWIRKS